MKYTVFCLSILFFLPLSGLNAQNISIGTVAIDAGHGGHDPGAISKDRKTYEKTLTLDIANRLKGKILKEYPELKVILTRPRDEFVSLNDRAAIANRMNADLFISIHINSSVSSSPNGYSVHVLGESSNKNRDLFAYNMDVCRQENSVILLEDDYTTKYQGFDPNDPESFIFMQLMQNSHLEQSLDLAQIMAEDLSAGPVKANRGVWQNPFYVLWKTSMPAVLVELGFISNSSDVQILRSPDNREAIADCLLHSFKRYKNKYDITTNVPASSVEVNLYGTQIFATSTCLNPSDKRFLGYPVRVFRYGNIYKYVIGVSDDICIARESFERIRKNYPSAFTVKITGDSCEISKF